MVGPPRSFGERKWGEHMLRALRGMSKREKRRILTDYAFLLPQLLFYVGLTIIPFFVSIPILFTDRNNFIDSTVQYIGFHNFTRVYTERDLWVEFGPALQRTVRFVIVHYAMIYVFGMTLALMMYEIGFRGEFFTIIYLPMMVSGLAVGFLAILLFGKTIGTVNLVLLELGWIKKAIDIKAAQGITIILPVLLGWRYAGFNMALFLSGLLSIPKETIEASVVDGASYIQRLFRVYFPQMIPSFIIATIFCIIGSFQVFAELVALGALYGNEDAQFLSVLFFNYAFGRGRLALGLTLSLELGIPLVILGVLGQRLQRRLQYEQ
jgi:multiple sugar transport system permease protein